MATAFNFLLNFLLVLTSLFLIALVLIQRGKGGGLAGAFGGVGGSSAFGTKAGDVFTRVTIGAATVWFILAMLLVVVNNRPQASAFKAGNTAGAAADSPNAVPITDATTTPKAADKVDKSGIPPVFTPDDLPAAKPTAPPVVPASTPAPDPAPKKAP